VRVIAASNKNSWELVREGRFRDDLYYRLKVVSITLPSLRERVDDISLLVQHFIEKFNRQTGKTLLGGTHEAMAALMHYSWPGNIRELENAIEHAFVLCRGQHFGLDDLPQEIGSVGMTDEFIDLNAPGEENLKRQRILTTLKFAGGLKRSGAPARHQPHDLVAQVQEDPRLTEMTQLKHLKRCDCFTRHQFFACYLERIFDEFAQMSDPRRDINKGWGWGLAICRRLIHLMGGNITVESDPNCGSSFSICLPPSSLLDREGENSLKRVSKQA
jgi:histidine kinase/DNA gyrase B/HSP90-like ATPase/sigma-54 interacting transcriptional regulator